MPSHLEKFGKIAVRSILFIVIPAIIIGGTLFALEGPTYTGVQTFTRNLNPITIKRDEFGVPTIEGKTLRDTMYGLGYVHGQDRLWVVNFRKLLFSGRLSESFGETTVKLDKFMRSLGIQRYAQYSLKYMEPHVIETIQAYVDGFNDAVKTLKVYPIEFWLTWTTPYKLTLEDVITFMKGLSFHLAYGFQFEAMYAHLESFLGPEKMQELMPTKEEHMLWTNVTILNDEELKQTGIYEEFNANKKFEAPPDQQFPEERRPPRPPSKITLSSDEEETKGKQYEPSTTPSAKTELPQDDILRGVADVQGSNAWIIHGNHTTTGKPIIANDPHLANGIPSFWYNAALIYEDNYVTGVSVPGLPAIVIGKAKNVAWGFTAHLMDTADLYNVTTKGNMYLYEGNWYPMKETRETIYVKGQNRPVQGIVYETHHGPVMDPYFVEFFRKRGYVLPEDTKYALAWMGYIDHEAAVNPFYKLLSVKTADEMVEAWSHSGQFGMNLHFAMSSGDIGYLLLGKIPIRPVLNSGHRPLDGSLKENDWLGWVPWEDQPRVINPKKGYISTANNKPASNNIKWHVTSNMVFTPRAIRVQEMIQERIANGKKISVEDVKTMQLDTLDVLARQMTPIIIKCVKEALRLGYTTTLTSVENLNKLLHVLGEWDYRMGNESVPATILSVWELQFKKKALKDLNFTEEARKTLTDEWVFENFIFRKVISWESLNVTLFDEYWCRNKENVGQTRPCLYNLAKSFEETWAFLEGKLGKDINGWQWGKLHFDDYGHTPLSSTLMKRFFHRSMSSPGNSRTVRVSTLDRSKGDYSATWSPNLRTIMSVGEKDNSFAIIDTGVSGRVQSPHYDDQMKAYYQDKWLLMREKPLEQWKDKLDITFSGSGQGQRNEL